MPNADTTDRGGEEVTKQEISKILVSSKYRTPVSPTDLAIYMVDIPAASDKILTLMTQYANAEVRKFGEQVEEWLKQRECEWNDKDNDEYGTGKHEAFEMALNHIQSLLKSLK